VRQRAAGTHDDRAEERLVLVDQARGDRLAGKLGTTDGDVSIGSAAERETALIKRGAQGGYRGRPHAMQFLELGLGDLGQLIQVRVAGT
jgi:hypothetical protein